MTFDTVPVYYSTGTVKPPRHQRINAMRRRTKRTLLPLAFAAALALPLTPALAAPPTLAIQAATTASTADPAAQLHELAQLFRAGDLAGLAQAALPPAQWQALQQAHELARLRPIDEEQRHAFAEAVARLTGPGAVDALMAQMAPRIEELRPQAPGAVQMAVGGLRMALASPDSGLDPAERAALAAALPGLEQWAVSTDFLDTATLRQAVTLLTDAARRTGIVDLEQLKALPLASLLDNGATLFVAGKDALRLYGMDVDAIVDSLQVEVLERTTDTARLRSTVTVFGTPVWHEHEMVLVDGRWYGKDVVAGIELDEEALASN